MLKRELPELKRWLINVNLEILKFKSRLRDEPDDIGNIEQLKYFRGLKRKIEKLIKEEEKNHES